MAKLIKFFNECHSIDSFVKGIDDLYQSLSGDSLIMHVIPISKGLRHLERFLVKDLKKVCKIVSMTFKKVQNNFLQSTRN